MPKLNVQWLLFTYIDGQITLLSKPFKKRADAEKAREVLPERQRKKIGIGVIRYPQG